MNSLMKHRDDRPAGEIVRHSARTHVQRVGLVVGFVALILLAVMPTPATFINHAALTLDLPIVAPDVLELAGGMKMTLSMIVIMVVWWVTEAVPIAITALIPGLLLTLLHVTGTEHGYPYVFDAKSALAPYASPVIYLFLAGFLLAGAMRKTGLDRRITLAILSWSPAMRGPGTILLVVMAITAGLSMWISNTATTALMLPIALMILQQLGQTPDEETGKKPAFGIVMMFGIAWAASIGGLGTIIGSPPNGIVVGILHNQGIAEVNFLQWMEMGVPISIVGIFAAWGLLMLQYRPKIGDTTAGLQAMRRARSKLGALHIDEIATLIVFLLAAVLWISHPFWHDILPASVFGRVERFGISEIGLLCAVILFVFPINRTDWRAVLDWRDAKYVDWGTLILFGGGIALSEAMLRTGLTDWFATGFVNVIGHPGPWFSLCMLVLLIAFLTEVTSNTAVTAMMTPVLIGLAPRLGLPPLTLCLACAMATSLAFMLPTATPPNALVYASGYFRIGQMARAGLLMDLIGRVVLVSGLYFIAGRLFGVVPLH